MPYIILCSNRALSKYFTYQSCNCSAKCVLRESQKRSSDFRGSVCQDYLFWQFTFALEFSGAQHLLLLILLNRFCHTWLRTVSLKKTSAIGSFSIFLNPWKENWTTLRFIFDVNRVISGGLFELEFVENVDQQSFTTAGAILGEADLWGLQTSLVDQRYVRSPDLTLYD